jgi:hypothetical protein
MVNVARVMAMAKRAMARKWAMATATTQALVTVTRMWATKRAMAMAARTTAMLMKVLGKEEGDHEGGKNDGNGNKGGG